jgi:outer membrane receptor protein involved in Fe transport
MHTGIGPFDIDSGSGDGLRQGQLLEQGVQGRVLHHDAERRRPTNQLFVDASDRHRQSLFYFVDQHLRLRASNVQTSTEARRDLRRQPALQRFDLSLAPTATTARGRRLRPGRDLPVSMFRLVAGARVDRFDYLDNFVFSPRVTFMIKPDENQTFRVSYNRAYRSPSVINNFLTVTIAEPLNLGAFTPLLDGQIYPLPVQSVGDPI